LGRGRVGTDWGHFLEGVDQDVILVSVCSLQIFFRNDHRVHFGVLRIKRHPSVSSFWRPS
jgi:hypothetical protein